MSSSEEIKEDFRPLDINKEFLEDLFGRQVSSFTLEAGSNPGDNYMSIMHAVEVNFKNENEEPAHIVIKCVPNHPTRRKFIKESEVFKKEFFVYDFWIPTLQKIQEEVGVNPPLKLAFPPYVGGQVSRPILGHTQDAINAARKADEDSNNIVEHDYIIMTDMRKLLKYKMVDRCKGLDYDHCKLVVKELAKIHAFSWAYKQRNGIKKLTDVYPHMKENMFTGKSGERFRPTLLEIMKTSFNTIEKGFGKDSPVYLGAIKLKSEQPDVHRAALLKSDGPDAEYMESHLRIKPPYDPSYNSEPWLLGCHGDCWLNNMLFKYDEATGIPETVALVDLQLYREGCPTSDLIYFFFSSTSSETRRNHEESLIRLYHDKFLEYCAALKCKPLPGFNLSSLKRRYRASKVVGFTWCMPLLTLFVLKEPKKVVDLEKVDEGQELNEMFTNVMAESDKNTVLCERICQMAQELYEDGVI